MLSLILLSALAAPASDLDAQAALALASASTRLQKPARQGLCGDSGCPCSKCGDYCSCSESGYPCGSAGCVCPASKVTKTWTGEDGRLWTWSEDEGGHWWAWKVRQSQSVQAPAYQPYHQPAPLRLQQPTYQPSFAPSYQSSYQGNFAAPAQAGSSACVGGR